MNQLLLGGFILMLSAIFWADGAATNPISWSGVDEDGLMEPLSPMTAMGKLLTAGSGWDDLSPPTTQEFLIGVGNSNETDEVPFQLPPLEFPEPIRNKRKSRPKSQGHSRSKAMTLPIELESFVGVEKVEPLRGSKSPAFQNWLNEMAQEARKVERIMKAEKRNHGGHAHQRHLWSCETEYGWRNLGRDHYPQFIRTATCSTTNCFSELFRCVPREYTLKVLKKLEPDETVPEPSRTLPEALRTTVKFINVTTNICCECSLG